jgi:N-methylhydantoinase A
MGLLMADLRVDKIWTQAFRSDQISPAVVEREFQRISEAALAELRQQGYTGEAELRYFINLRYLGQNYETEIEIPSVVAGGDWLARAYETFHREHKALYGYDIPTMPIELVNFKVTAVGAIPRPQIGTVQSVDAVPAGERLVYFAGAGLVPCQVVRRSALAVGERVAGPLIVEEEGSTTVVEPGMHLTRTEHDILLLDVK